MAATALYAPAHRVRPRTANGHGSPDQAPSMDYGGIGLQDPRLAYDVANSATGAGILGWIGGGAIKVASAVPAVKSATNIAAAANAVSGVAMALVSSTGAGITVVPTGGFRPFPNYSISIPAGALAIDGLPSYTRFGSHFITAFYNPAAAIARCVTITGATSGTGGAFLISGWDFYGYPMSQLLTVGAGAVSATTGKAFKFIGSVVPQFSDAHTYSVGTADVFGLNLAADYFGDCRILWDNVAALAATFTPAVTTDPATTLTGDVRGRFTPGLIIWAAALRIGLRRR